MVLPLSVRIFAKAVAQLPLPIIPNCICLRLFQDKHTKGIVK
jgi:hypothetical protein